MLNLSDLKQTRVYQEALAEGLEQGLEQGLERGRQQEGVTLITRLLERKFGELPSGLRSPLAHLTLTQLELLADALLDFSSLDEVTDWLNRESED